MNIDIEYLQSLMKEDLKDYELFLKREDRMKEIEKTTQSLSDELKELKDAHFYSLSYEPTSCGYVKRVLNETIKLRGAK